MPSTTMLAALWHGQGVVTIESVRRPTPSPHEALIRVSYTGLCGSDAEEYRHGPVVARPPRILGHEIVGVVERAAEDGSGPTVGTRVVVDVVDGCGHCFYCHRHLEGLCADLSVLGQHRDGGLAQFVSATAGRLIPLPEHLTDRRAALAEPAAVAVRAVRAAGPISGDDVVVFGGGAVGMLVAQVARAATARVLVLEPNPERRAIIERWGIASAWAADERDRAKIVHHHSAGAGPAVVFECAGRPGTTRESVRLSRRGGSTIVLGVLNEDEPVDVLDLVLGEKNIHGSAAHMWDDDVSVAVGHLAAGTIVVDDMITDVLPLADVAAAFDRITQAGATVVKLLVDCTGDGRIL
jgi:(R,R)-butanediol dehydrogenase / meso-butanediol dehydrogenase / diacetyl reductase